MDKYDIPSDFYSFETVSLFERCIECEKYLLDGETEYLIEKAVKNYKNFDANDIVFDYAMCMDCAENLRKEISPESWQKMKGYFQENIDIEKHLEMINGNPDKNLQSCMIKGTNVSQCQEYRIYAYCKGTKLNMENPPYLISGEVMEEIIPLLSDKTVDEMNGFFNKHFSPDPSFFEPTPKLILV